jgi:hypothetical protein
LALNNPGLAIVPDGRGKRTDQAIFPIHTNQELNAAVGTNQAAAEGGNFLAPDNWQRDGEKCSVVAGGHGRFRTGIESGVIFIQSVCDLTGLTDARQRIMVEL